MAQGLSYYADESVAQRLRIPAEAVRAGRAELLLVNDNYTYPSATITLTHRLTFDMAWLRRGKFPFPLPPRGQNFF